MRTKRNTSEIYTGNDLGVTYSRTCSKFRLWSPQATSVCLRFFMQGSGDEPYASYPMMEGEGGTWIYSCEGDLNGIYYDYQIVIDGVERNSVDPYAKAVGVNGNRGMIIDLKSTDPEGFRDSGFPTFIHLTDAVIYELHVRDFTIDEESGVKQKGKYLGLTELGTTNSDGLYTGLSHIKELGVTHVQLMPVFDYATIDEAKESSAYNWGYDPKNYNVPEGSYSSNPHLGATRIKELKKVIQTFHENGIRVVMDVVYNHMFCVDGSVFQNTAPDYFFRKNADEYSDASGCGNETASERYMVRKFMIDSVLFWAEEYQFDGFRFDLMGIHDVETMNEIKEALDKLNRGIICYGEGWTCSTSVYPASDRLLKDNIIKCPGIGAFSDHMRDAIKGSVFSESDGGYLGSRHECKADIMHGIVAETAYYGNNFPLNGDKWALFPSQAIHYVSCHDNHTLWDKLQIANTGKKSDVLKKMNKVAVAMVILSQGIPFFLSGEEILRSKRREDGTFAENSYNMPDCVNEIKWSDKKNNVDIFNYYKGLIELRKGHNLFRLRTAEEIILKLRFVKTGKKMIAFYLQDENEKILVIYNVSRWGGKFVTEKGKWKVLVNDKSAGNMPICEVNGMIHVPSRSTLVLVQ